ncbi:MAG: SRPBCC family protein [Gammaproteobacteria bacterium]|nr:SRPBCC family protein [Gammaproteobacteria bacterium]
MKSIEHTRAFDMDRPAAELFALFSPEGETRWVPGWNYENLMETTVLCEDYVFLTRTQDHGSGETIWVVKRYDPAAYRVEFYRIEPNQKVGTVKVRCTALDSERTRVEVTYKYQALSRAGEAFISGFSATAYDGFIDEWQTLLTNYFDSTC